GGDVADLAAGGGDGHDGGAAVVGGAHALHGGVEVGAELLGLLLLAEDLAEHGDLALELVAEGPVVARVQLEDRGVGRVLHEVGVVRREARAVDDEGGLAGAHGREGGLAVVAQVDDRLVVPVGVGRGHQGARGGGGGHAPVREGLEGAVVGRDHGGGRDLDGLGAVVVLDLDGALGGAVVRRTGGVGLAGGGAARGEGEAEGTGGGEGAEVAPGEGGHGERTFSE